jgi:hypothetical protein
MSREEASPALSESERVGAETAAKLRAAEEARSIFGWESDNDQSDDVDTFSMARLHVLCLQLGFFFGWQAHSFNCLVLRDDSAKVEYMLYFSNSQRNNADQILRFQAECLERFVDGPVDDLERFQSWIIQAFHNGISSVCTAISTYYPTDHTILSEYFVDPEVADLRIMLLFARLLYVYRREFLNLRQIHSDA